MVVAVITAVIVLVTTNVDDSLYHKKYIFKNHFWKPLSEGEDHCWLLWAENKGDKLSDSKCLGQKGRRRIVTGSSSDISVIKLIWWERKLKVTQTDQFTVHWSQESHSDFSQRCVVPNYSVSRTSPSNGYYLTDQELRAGLSGFSKGTHAKGRGILD